MKIRLLLATLLASTLWPAARATTIVTYSGGGEFVYIEPGGPWGVPAVPLPYGVNFSFLLPAAGSATTTGSAKLSANGVDILYSGEVGWSVLAEGPYSGLGSASLAFGDINLYFEVWDQPFTNDSVQNLLKKEDLWLYTTYKGSYDDIGGVSLVSAQQVPEGGSTLALVALAAVPVFLIRRRRA